MDPITSTTQHPYEHPTSYGSTQRVSVSPASNTHMLHISVPASVVCVCDGEINNTTDSVAVLFFHVSWETLLVHSRSRDVASLLPRGVGRVGTGALANGSSGCVVVVEEVEPDAMTALLIPNNTLHPHLSVEPHGAGDGQGLYVADVQIPTELQTTPFIVAVRTASDICRTHFFKVMPQVMAIIPEQRTGVLRVVDRVGRPLVGCYVRVMVVSSLGGGDDDGDKRLGFWKDGYTDLVGRFDYATVSSQDIHTVSGFVLYAEQRGVGCCLQRVGPPDV
eukprot:gnl/Chilomastix_caulleri/264.p1 GENE.gnl/Chilomastix_caulleri/264~~gnl/Chilomastix_caulleri/264.p1  ORF type:complete len:277 (+),score=111.55 gnl/Chilomastix_caulleri/264:15-845(+)